MEFSKVKIIVFVPVSHADRVRQAMGEAGAGQIGNYSYCSFSSIGQGRYLPGNGANPTIGKVGKFEVVEEERVEVVCHKSKLESVIQAAKSAHPYEEVAFDVYPLIDLS